MFATSLEAVLLQLLGTLFTQLVRLLIFLVRIRQTSRPRPYGYGRAQLVGITANREGRAVVKSVLQVLYLQNTCHLSFGEGL